MSKPSLIDKVLRLVLEKGFKKGFVDKVLIEECDSEVNTRGLGNA